MHLKYFFELVIFKFVFCQTLLIFYVFFALYFYFKIILLFDIFFSVKNPFSSPFCNKTLFRYNISNILLKLYPQKSHTPHANLKFITFRNSLQRSIMRKVIWCALYYNTHLAFIILFANRAWTLKMLFDAIPIITPFSLYIENLFILIPAQPLTADDATTPTIY